MVELKIDGCNKKYLIDEDGNIFDVKENKFRKPSETNKGYLKVSFYINGKYKSKFVHRLVITTFNPVENMENLQVNHIDGNKKNNNINNLEWCTLQENMSHAWKNGLCSNSSPYGNLAHHKKIDRDIVDLILLDLKNGISYSKIANKYNISKSTVYQIKNGITWNK